MFWVKIRLLLLFFNSFVVRPVLSGHNSFCRHFCAVKLVRNSSEFWVSKDFRGVATLCKAIHIQWAALHSLASLFWCPDRMFDTPSLRLCLLCCLVIWELIWLHYWLFALWNLPTNNRPKQHVVHAQVFGIPEVCGWRSERHSSLH